MDCPIFICIRPAIIDPLTEVVSLLQPQALYAKVVSGAGSWRVCRTEEGEPFYCVVAEGSCFLLSEGHPPVSLHAGDFVLIPSTQGFAMSSHDSISPSHTQTVPVELSNGEFRIGDQDAPPDVQVLIGHSVFNSPDTALLISLLPRLIHIRGDKRLAMIVQLVVDESRSRRPARDVILARLLEVLMIEALRSIAGNADSPGLVRALADERIATVIRQIHETPAHPWTIELLAKQATLSRSAFYERFTGAMGIAPMEYLFILRMALAKNLLRKKEANVAEVADRIGYGSASAFSVAFTRHVGIPPARYAKQQT